MELLAPIVAVTVHPERARVTRRGRAVLPAGPSELVVAGLPESLLEDSVRVAGHADGTVRVVGVDLAHRDLAEVPDERVRAAEGAVLEAERAVAAVDAVDVGDAAREQLLVRLASRSGDRLAAALADGSAGTGRVAEVGAAVAAQLVEVATARRANAERRNDAQHALYAAREALGRLQSSGRHRRDAVVEVEAGVEGEVELELTYVVGGAGWSPAYDARLDEKESVTLTVFGMVTQVTGEDWPPCELTLSTARPAVSTSVPELDPWWVDVARPVMPVMARAAAVPLGAMDMAAGGMEVGLRQKVTQVEATAVESTLSASWRLARPTAVPSDGTPHRTTVTTLDLRARLDHVTAPALSPDAHLRATVMNTGGQPLLAGPVSTFLEDAFVGTSVIGQTAPGAEIELALGVDDRVTVERELVERTAHKARFGTNRGGVERWTITVTNGRATPARVTVRDRLPVSRTADIKVVEVSLTPEPAERDELGRVEWIAQIGPGATWKADIRFGVEHPKDMPITGWN